MQLQSFSITKKYRNICSIVSQLDSSTVAGIFKHANTPYVFFPSLGLFSVEFFLGYCNNLHSSKKTESVESPKKSSR
jgi:hypothetical protein